MAKRTEENKVKQFTAKVHKQHSSLTLTVPMGLCKMLEIVKGDILLFEVEPGDCAAVVGKLAIRGSEHGQKN